MMGIFPFIIRQAAPSVKYTKAGIQSGDQNLNRPMQGIAFVSLYGKSVSVQTAGHSGTICQKNSDGSKRELAKIGVKLWQS